MRIAFILPVSTFLLISIYSLKKFQASEATLDRQIDNNAEEEEKEAGSISMMSEKNYTSGLVEVKLVLRGELFPSIITTESNGTLSHLISAYASLMYFQHLHGMHAILADWQINKLSEVFQKEKFEISPSTVEMPPQFSVNWEKVVDPASEVASSPDEKFLENIKNYEFNNFLDIGLAPNFLSLYKEILDDLREQLLFNQGIQGMVDQTLMDVKQQLGGDKEIIFVGVDCQDAGDAQQNSSSVAGAGVDYFERAFAIFRTRHNTPTTQVIFLAIGDHKAWIKESLGKHEDVKFGQDLIQGKVSEPDMPGYTLCLLAACNHSIHMRSSRGAWGSLLAGGDVIAAKEAGSKEGGQFAGWDYLEV